MMSNNFIQISLRLDQETKEKLQQIQRKSTVKKSRNQIINDLIKRYYEKNFLFKSNNIESEILEIMYNENQKDIIDLIKKNEEDSFKVIKMLDYIFNDIKINYRINSEIPRTNFYSNDKDIDY